MYASRSRSRPWRGSRCAGWSRGVAGRAAIAAAWSASSRVSSGPSKTSASRAPCAVVVTSARAPASARTRRHGPRGRPGRAAGRRRRPSTPRAARPAGRRRGRAARRPPTPGPLRRPRRWWASRFAARPARAKVTVARRRPGRSPPGTAAARRANSAGTDDVTSGAGRWCRPAQVAPLPRGEQVQCVQAALAGRSPRPPAAGAGSAPASRSTVARSNSAVAYSSAPMYAAVGLLAHVQREVGLRDRRHVATASEVVGVGRRAGQFARRGSRTPPGRAACATGRARGPARRPARSNGSSWWANASLHVSRTPRQGARGTASCPSSRQRSTRLLRKNPTTFSISGRSRPATGVPTTTSHWPVYRASRVVNAVSSAMNGVAPARRAERVERVRDRGGHGEASRSRPCASRAGGRGRSVRSASGAAPSSTVRQCRSSFVDDLVGAALALPDRVVGVLHGQRRAVRARGPRAAASRSSWNSLRSTVADQPSPTMWCISSTRMLLAVRSAFGGADEHRPGHRPVDEVEAPAELLFETRRRSARARRVDDAQLHRSRRVDRSGRARRTPRRSEPGTQRLVPLDERVQRLPHRARPSSLAGTRRNSPVTHSRLRGSIRSSSHSRRWPKDSGSGPVRGTGRTAGSAAPHGLVGPP